VKTVESQMFWDRGKSTDISGGRYTLSVDVTVVLAGFLRFAVYSLGLSGYRYIVNKEICYTGSICTP